MTVPAFGLGTFRLKDQTVIDSVRNALEVGYRAIDTAQASALHIIQRIPVIHTSLHFAAKRMDRSSAH